MYLISITAGLAATYFVLRVLFSLFFRNEMPKITKRSFLSVALIILLSGAGYALVLSIPDLEWGNRVLHGFGGGFIAFLICFLVVKDSRLEIRRFQFFIFSALVVTGLGVANEILEYFLQNYGGLVFLRTTNDTWLDLISNTVGILIAAAVFVPFIGEKVNPNISRAD